MDVGGTTWIVAADGAHARIFEERLRSAEVRELSERAMCVGESDLPHAHQQMATVHDRHGGGRHGAGEGNPREETVHRFLRRLAKELEAGAHRGDFDSLVLIAPPRALGILRSELSPALYARVTASDPHDIVREDAEQVRARLRTVRAGTWRR